MCLISVAPKGTDKYSKKFIDGLICGAKSNTDGMGYTFKKASNKKVYISKGWKDVNSLIDALKKHGLTINDELIVHQRVGNKGSKGVDMCHPFVLSNEKETILLNDQYVDYPTMVHNGTFNTYSKYNSIYSDTFFFIEEFMHRPELIQLMQNDLAFFKNTFDIKLSTNRLAFLFPKSNHKLIMIGEFKEDEGFFFSNETYKNPKIRNCGGYDSDDAWGEYGYGRGSACGYPNSRNNWGNANRALTERTYWDNLNDIEDDEDDEFVEGFSTVTKTSGGVKSNLDTLIDKHNCKIKDLEDEKKNKFTPASEGDIVVKGGITEECKLTTTKYRLYSGMWIPEQYMSASQYGSIRWAVNEFNYLDFSIRAIADDHDTGIIKDTYYDFVKFDTTAFTKSGSDALHTMCRKYSAIGNFDNSAEHLYIPGYMLPQYFEIKPKPNKQGEYHSLYRLLAAFTPTKTMVSKLRKGIKDYSKKTGTKSHFVDFRGIKNVHINALHLAIRSMIIDLFPHDYKSELAKLDLEPMMNLY